MTMTKSYPECLTELRRSEFNHLDGATYLDFAGSGVYSKSQLENYFDDLKKNLYGNPHSINPSSNLSTNAIKQVRETILKFFNVSSEDYECVFTKNATGALHLIAASFDWTNNSIFAYLEDNHTSVVGIRETAKENNCGVYCLENISQDKNSEKHFDLKQDFRPVKLSNDYVVPVCSSTSETKSNCLFAYPAQSNFNGQKYPLNWADKDTVANTMLQHIPIVEESTGRDWFVLCDTASFVTTSPLDLSAHPFDFIPISFYKIFGFPTGVGALLVRKSARNALSKKHYFGGGAAKGWLAAEDFYLPPSDFQAMFEDGTVAFLDILAIQHGFNFFTKLQLNSMSLIQDHAFSLIQQMYQGIISLKHSNGFPLVQVYTFNNYISKELQGPMIAFNLLDSQGDVLGYNKVLELATSWNIHLRSGCFCNIGACCKHLKIPVSDLKKSFEDGSHSCGDTIDVMNGIPLGAIRVSVGYCSTMEDVDKFVKFLRENFLSTPHVRQTTNSLHKIPKLEEIMLYPVKSCRGMSVKSWMITDSGLLYDRYWMVVDEKYVFISLKKNTKMALVQPSVDIDDGMLTLEYKGTDKDIKDLNCKFVEEANVDQTSVISFKMFDGVNFGIDCGEEASEWISKVLGVKSRLIQLVKNHNRHLSLVNKSQYLLINKGSVDHLTEIIKQSQTVANGDNNSVFCDTESLKFNFRANFIVSGVDAFSEETWKTVQFNDVVFTTDTVCQRCSLISVDPFTGRRFKEPLKSLFINMKRKNFGIYLNSSSKCSIINVDHEVKVTF